jgi:uncharacterized protein YciW
MTTDVIDDLLGLHADAPLAALRRQRPAAVEAIAASRDALFAADAAPTLTLAERAAVAQHVATRDGDAGLAAHYREQGTGPATPRLAAMLRHADRLLDAPASATPAHLAELAAAGLAPRDIVVLSQLVAFVTFETRLLAGMRLMGARP